MNAKAKGGDVVVVTRPIRVYGFDDINVGDIGVVVCRRRAGVYPYVIDLGRLFPKLLSTNEFEVIGEIGGEQ